MCVGIFEGHSKNVNSVDCLNSHRMFVSGGADKTVRLWTAFGADHSVLKEHTASVLCVRIDGVGNQIVSGSKDKTVRIWSVKSRKCLHVLRGHSGWINDVEFLTFNSIVSVSPFDRTVRIWNTSTGVCVEILDDCDLFSDRFGSRPGAH